MNHNQQNRTNEIRIEFTNTAQTIAQIYWLSPQGNEILYRILQPGERYRQASLPHYQWLIKRQTPDRFLNSYTTTQEPEQVYEITLDDDSTPTNPTPPPEDIPIETLVATLKEASQLGTPFCEGFEQILTNKRLKT